jgi:hypothetical protein
MYTDLILDERLMKQLLKRRPCGAKLSKIEEYKERWTVYYRLLPYIHKGEIDDKWVRSIG